MIGITSLNYDNISPPLIPFQIPTHPIYKISLFYALQKLLISVRIHLQSTSPKRWSKRKSTKYQAILYLVFIISDGIPKVPAIWKRSFIRPFFKSGYRKKNQNYRGVALPCVISKLFDSIMTQHLNVRITNILDDSQHGFVKGRSTTTNLAEFLSCVQSTSTSQKLLIQSMLIYSHTNSTSWVWAVNFFPGSR